MSIDRYICEKCGLPVSCGQGQREKHEAFDLFHIKADLMKELLARGARLKEIGDELGVTRERARQILNKLKITGKQLRDLREGLKPAMPEKKRLVTELENELLEICREKGIEYELGERTNDLWLNGLFCHVGRLHEMRTTKSKSLGKVYAHLLPQKNSEFAILKFTVDSSWWVFPSEAIRKSTTFSVKHKDGGYWHHCLNYPSFRGAWHLITREKKNGQVQGASGGDGQGSGQGESVSS